MGNPDVDRELLELAAKAAGIDLVWDGPPSHCDVPRFRDRDAPSIWWNPLNEDGDALRLAVKLRICIEFGDCMDDAPIVRCGWLTGRDDWHQHANFPDSGATTRRAIVMAAAEIGRIS